MTAHVSLARFRPHWTPDAVVYALPQLRDWLFAAAASERCLYHVGQMLVDQEDRPQLKRLGDYAALMADLGALVLTQRRMGDGLYQYFAARTGLAARSLPRAVSTCEVDVPLYLAIRAVHTRPAAMAARRAICRALSCSEAEAGDIFQRLVSDGLIEDGRPPVLTDAGRKALA